MSNAQMTEKVPGGPMPAAADAIHAEARAGIASRTGGVDSHPTLGENNFPMVPIAPDAYDDYFDIKRKFTANAANPTDRGGVGLPQAPAWVVPFEKSDAEYFARQRDRAEKAAYDSWLYKKFDLSDLPTAAMIQQIAPEIWQRREEFLNYQLALVDRYARLRLYGPKSEADLKLQWLVETGRIRLPSYNLWQPTQHNGQPAVGMQTMQEAYRAGKFSPLAQVMSAFTPIDPNTRASDIAMTGPADRYRGHYVHPEFLRDPQQQARSARSGAATFGYNMVDGASNNARQIGGATMDLLQW